MNGRPRTLGLIVAVEDYDPAADLVGIPGAGKDALTFYDWLLTVGGAKPEDIELCTSPVARNGVEATRTMIRDAAMRLAVKATLEPADLFVMYSGHGGQVGDEDILIPADYRAGDGDTCIRLSQLRQELRHAMAPGAHYWFVNCCRSPVAIEVPRFSLGRGPSPLGRGTKKPNSLFAAIDGAPAPVRSPFNASLERALNGCSRAKRWLDKDYWVVFNGLAEFVNANCPGMDVSWDTDRDDRIYKLQPPPPDVDIVVKIQGAQTGEEFTLYFSGTRPVLVQRLIGPSTPLSVPPGDWWVTLMRKGLELESRPVDTFEPVEIEFDLGSGAAILPLQPSPPPGQLSFERSGHGEVTLQVSQAGRPFDDVEPGAIVSIDPNAGPFEVQLLDRDEPVRRLGMPGPDLTIDLAAFPGSPVHDTLRGIVNRPGLLRFTDLLPESAPDEVIADPNPAATLAVLGGSAICGVGPYPAAVSGLNQFDWLAQERAALYVLTRCPVDWGNVASTPVTIEFASVAEFDGRLRHSGRQVEPGLHRIRVSVGNGDIELPFIAIPDHVTMVVLGTGSPSDEPDVGFQPLQFALPPGDRFDREAGMPRAEALSAIRFGALVQRRFAEGRPVMAAKPHPTHVTLWRELRSGRWPDPLTMLVAAYELVRRGAIAHDATTLLRLLDRLEERFGEYRPPDLDVLWALVDRATPAVQEIPLVLDGAMATDVSVDANPAGMALEYTGLWTRWRTWASAPAEPRSRAVLFDLRPKVHESLPSERAVGQVRSAGARARLIRMSRLERQTYDPYLRQALVDELCAYLRSPRQSFRLGESQDDLIVRVVIQSTLARHLRRDQDWGTNWPEVTLDLSGANLVDLDLSGCHLVGARFDRATFTGARFEGTHFVRPNFYATTFHGEANFRAAVFDGPARFTHANFGVYASFDEAQFADRALFDDVQFHYWCRFTGAKFRHEARFDRARFGDNAHFDDAQFHGTATFDHARFTGRSIGSEPRIIEGAAWARLDISEDLAEARTWPPGFSVVPTADTPEPGAAGEWGRLIGPGVSARILQPATLSVY
jgi:uncharacterized protein YjbI with pentapeptide repeats